MPAKRRLVDITKLKKSSWLVCEETDAVVKEAQAAINKQERFMNEVGMDKQHLRNYIYSDAWPASHRHKARQELLKLSDDLKEEMSREASLKRKEIRQSSRLLKSKKTSGASTRRRRTGFV